MMNVYNRMFIGSYSFLSHILAKKQVAKLSAATCDKKAKVLYFKGHSTIIENEKT